MQEQSVETGPSLERSIGLGRVLFQSVTTMAPGASVVFGLGLGGEYLVIPLMAAELFGVRVLGRALGVVLTADGVAEALAPVLVGRMHDVTGSYVSGFSAAIALALAGAIAIVFLPRPERVAHGVTSPAAELA